MTAAKSLGQPTRGEDLAGAGRAGEQPQQPVPHRDVLPQLLLSAAVLPNEPDTQLGDPLAVPGRQPLLGEPPHPRHTLQTRQIPHEFSYVISHAGEPMPIHLPPAHIVRGYFGGPHVRHVLDENPISC
ncbi:hypothetical protein WDV06_34320 [Streptomyces racemochromogenes]|uniref:Uncharacterized protein n=1 Tax=Streptomyces racemochromogenes TaxID=67353 RepID=A0ABW7PNY2_9ACTN